MKKAEWYMVYDNNHEKSYGRFSKLADAIKHREELLPRMRLPGGGTCWLSILACDPVDLGKVGPQGCEVVPC